MSKLPRRSPWRKRRCPPGDTQHYQGKRVIIGTGDIYRLRYPITCWIEYSLWTVAAAFMIAADATVPFTVALVRYAPGAITRCRCRLMICSVNVVAVKTLMRMPALVVDDAVGRSVAVAEQRREHRVRSPKDHRKRGQQRDRDVRHTVPHGGMLRRGQPRRNSDQSQKYTTEVLGPWPRRQKANRQFALCSHLCSAMTTAHAVSLRQGV